MRIRKFGKAAVDFEKSPGQDGEVYVGNVIDQRDGGPITIGYGRYGANQVLNEVMGVDDVMVVLEGSLTVSSRGESVTAGVGEIIYMPKGVTVKIESGAEGAVTAYVTYPHWMEAGGRNVDPGAAELTIAGLWAQIEADKAAIGGYAGQSLVFTDELIHDINEYASTPTMSFLSETGKYVAQAVPVMFPDDGERVKAMRPGQTVSFTCTGIEEAPFEGFILLGCKIR